MSNEGSIFCDSSFSMTSWFTIDDARVDANKECRDCSACKRGDQIATNEGGNTGEAFSMDASRFLFCHNLSDEQKPCEVLQTYLLETGTRPPLFSMPSDKRSRAHRSLSSSSPPISAAPKPSDHTDDAATFASPTHLSISRRTLVISVLYCVFSEASRVVILRSALYCLRRGESGERSIDD